MGVCVLIENGKVAEYIEHKIAVRTTVRIYCIHKCTKHQLIHLLTATLKNSHIENSKNHKR